ncbi:NACHT domain protein [Aspergillus aculeatinus CBS 121060]|uniref:NACHT domain protein n=1 Tax=Aspergillus aculeatinus CBS 121060 TaxID=1448322 RepID=A0ACD1H5C8_9EURO|nr:NACHT domain protein [Aspergillus aculeatinus CBS 121060]RAH68765.1 NACHT domain protein [Aspergillus aculeatinus CBS 121060]
MSAAQSLIQNAFDAAVQEFKANLNNDAVYQKILSVTSIDEVYDLTDQLQAEQGRKGHLRHLAKIEPYLNRLRDYAAVIENFVQIKPEIMALIWGPIKLLLQWSSVLAQSFDAILQITGDIGVLLPEFQDCAVLFAQNSRIYDLMVLFFKDILDFYQVGLKFFTMSRWKYFFESVWPRKRDRINLVKTHIERHSLLMRNEVRLEHIREEHEARLKALEHFKAEERAQRLQQFHVIKTDVNPRMYDDKLNWCHGRICDGSGAWLLRDKAFTSWLDFSAGTPPILWLQGIPGAGKTFLASLAIDKTRTVAHTAFAFLSHTYSSSTSALSVLHSLIFQLAGRNEDMQDVLCHSTHDRIRSDVTVAVELLRVLLNCAGPAFLVVDGVDEIEELERGILLNQLLLLPEKCPETRVFISSRRESDIAAILEKISESIRIDKRNQEGIQAFISQQLGLMFESREFPPDVQAQIRQSMEPLASKANGMFLYAKVVLSSIELLDDVAEICEELSLLPEDLDSAYARILLRINNLRPASVKAKARRILAWVGCSPTPLTSREMEQALSIQPGKVNAGKRLSAAPNLNKLCGPIVEVIGEEYVQFVHFTVKEYFFSTAVTGHISFIDGTLDLATTCITYFCQGFHNPDVVSDDDQFTQHLIEGGYRLHYYAQERCFEVLQIYLRLLDGAKAPSSLLNCLNMLMATLRNDRFALAADDGRIVEASFLRAFQTDHPELYQFLYDIYRFRHMCSQETYHLNEETKWVDFDPLASSQVSIRLYQYINKAQCASSSHNSGCQCGLLDRVFGLQAYRCGYLNCPLQRRGFESIAIQKRHEDEHTRVWKCPVSGCEYEKTGFLSANMRDQHAIKAHRKQHNTNDIVHDSHMSPEDEVEFILDLVRSNDIEAINSLPLTLFEARFRFANSHRLNLGNVLGEFGSASTVGILLPFADLTSTYSGAIQASNTDLLSWLIDTKTIDKGQWRLAYVCKEFVKCDSAEMYDFGRRWFAMIRFNRLYLPVMNEAVIGVTARLPRREDFLVSLWDYAWMELRQIDISQALKAVAKTTCSLRLGQILIQHGAKVNCTVKSKITALGYATNKPARKNAQFAKFLLFHGADPQHTSASGRKISDQIGAKRISHWLGISWDDLVEQARAHADENATTS